MRKNASKIKVVYIGGVEHNGSTFLGTILGNHLAVEFVGELSLLPRVGWLSNYKCTCGEEIQKCNYWESVRDSWEKEVNDTVNSLVELESQVDRRYRFPQVVIQKRFFSKNFATYSQYVCALFQSIQAVSGKSIIVDSSKRFSRALALSEVDCIDLKIIHLIRDARGVAYSFSKPKRLKQRSVWASTLRWNLSNISYGFIGKMLDESRLKVVRYEDFVEYPSETLNKISQFIGLDFSDIATKLVQNKSLAVGAHVGVGNGFLQNVKTVKLRSDQSWQQKMPRNKQQKVWAVTQWGMRHHGYRR